MNINIKIKTCTKCRKTKDKSNEFFALDRQKRDGFSSWCKECVGLYGKARKRYKKEIKESETILVECVGVKSRNIFCGKTYPAIKKHFKFSKLEGLSKTCRNCARKAWHLWNRENKRSKPNDRISKQAKLKFLYGMSIEEFETRIEIQENKCEICNEYEIQVTRKGNVRNLCVDHNHQTGKARGIICSACNITLSGFDKNKSITLDEYLNNIKNYYKKYNG